MIHSILLLYVFMAYNSWDPSTNSRMNPAIGIYRKVTCFFLAKRSLNLNHLQHSEVMTKVSRPSTAKMQNIEVNLL